MYCRECGKEINDKAVICLNCGCATDMPIPKSQSRAKNLGNIPNEKYTGFSFRRRGRTSRKSFWIQSLLIYGLAFVFFLLTFIVIGAAISPDSLSAQAAAGYIGLGGILVFTLAIIFLYACLMLAIRRVHDFGCTGWLALLILIPNAGFIAWIVFGCIPSEESANQYGSEPDVI